MVDLAEAQLQLHSLWRGEEPAVSRHEALAAVHGDHDGGRDLFLSSLSEATRLHCLCTSLLYLH